MGVTSRLAFPLQCSITPPPPSWLGCVGSVSPAPARVWSFRRWWGVKVREAGAPALGPGRGPPLPPFPSLGQPSGDRVGRAAGGALRRPRSPMAACLPHTDSRDFIAFRTLKKGESWGSARETGTPVRRWLWQRAGPEAEEVHGPPLPRGPAPQLCTAGPRAVEGQAAETKPWSAYSREHLWGNWGVCL